MTTIPEETPEPVDTPSEPVTDAASVNESIAAGTADVGQGVDALVALNALENPEHQQTIHAALTFVDSTERKSETDIADVATSVGTVMGDYEQNGQDAPEVVNAVYSRLELLSRRTYIAAAGEELMKEEPNLMVLLRCMRMASMNANTLPAEMQKEIELLRQEIEMRDLHSPTYNRMCELSVVVGQAITHLSSTKNIATANILRGSLINGALPESIKTAASLLPKIRADEGKNGEESRAALQQIADRLTDMLTQLQAMQSTSASPR